MLARKTLKLKAISERFCSSCGFIYFAEAESEQGRIIAEFGFGKKGCDEENLTIRAVNSSLKLYGILLAITVLGSFFIMFQHFRRGELTCGLVHFVELELMSF